MNAAVDVRRAGPERPEGGVDVLDDGATVVDLAYAVDGDSLPAAHAESLASAIGDALPWLADEPAAAIHPLRTSPTTGGEVLLARRTRLVLRIPEPRIGDARALEGRRLAVAGRTLVVGAGARRPLAPAPTLYAARVASRASDDRAFHEEIAGWLAGCNVRCQVIEGRSRTFRTYSMEITTWGLALHGLPPDDSLRVQRLGCGPFRLLGCGIFVPHKAIAVAD